jgi:acyl-CoA reductase-like NAD-dependent aldehyde dehydrogenase
LSGITALDWQRMSEDADQRAKALRDYANYVFKDEEASIRWLMSRNTSITTNETPVAACRTAQGFFEAMADLARIYSFEQRETLRRIRQAVAPRAQIIPIATARPPGASSRDSRI